MSFFNGEKDNESRFHVYGIGVAVKDKVKFSDELEIYLVEQFPYVEGKLTEAKVEHKSELPDSKGTTKSHEVKGGYTITAKWLPDGANNQITAPDVYKGESVKILRSPKVLNSVSLDLIKLYAAAALLWNSYTP